MRSRGTFFALLVYNLGNSSSYIYEFAIEAKVMNSTVANVITFVVEHRILLLTLLPLLGAIILMKFMSR